MPTIEQLEVRYRSDIAAKAQADAQGLTAVATGMAAVETAAERQDQKLTRASASFDRLKASLDGNEAATRRLTAAQEVYQRRLEAIDAARQRGDIATDREALALKQRLAVQLDQATARAVAHGQAIEARYAPAMQQAARATDATAAASDRASHALRGLGMQSIDVFQQLASGAPVLTTFVQQGGQVVQQSAAMGVGLGTLARGAAGVVLAYAPMIAAFGAAAAAAGVAYSVFARSNELASQQRALSVAIQGVGRSAELSSTQLQGYVKQLERQGVSSADAVSSVSGLARNSGLSSGAIGRIVGLAPDAAAALGTSTPDMMHRLAEAARGSADAVIKLTDAFNLLSPAEEISVRRMIAQGDQAQALETVFGKLAERVSGLGKNALSPAEQAARDLGNAWSTFVDRVAGSDLVIGAIERLASALRSIAGLIGPGGSAAPTLQALDAQIAALSGDIPGTNATAARLRREQAEGRERLLAQRTALAQSLADQAEFGGGIPPTVSVTMPAIAGGMAAPGAAAAREVDRAAAARVAGTPQGQVRALTEELERYQRALRDIPRGTEEWTARAPALQQAITATAKAIEEARKKGEEHLSGLEKARAGYENQTRAARELAEAHRTGADAVAQVTAKREAEGKAISENLIPGTARYAATVSDLTARILGLRQAEASAKAAERVADLDEATAAQLRINAAYDGTEASVTKAQNAEKALADARRAGVTPGAEGYAETVSKIADAYDRSLAAAEAFRHSQQSVQAILGALETTADRIGQALVDGFLNGRNAAVTMASVVRAAFASLATETVRLGAINPLINGVLGTSRPSLWTGLGTLAGGGAGGTAAGGGLFSSLFGQAGNALSIARIGDALGITDIGGQLSGLGRYLGLTGDGGLFSGVTGFLNQPLFGTVNSGTALLDSMGITAGMPGTGIPTIGNILGGVGLGFGAGSMLGGFLQRSMNRTGPAPTIGAGLGAGAGAAIGSIIPGVGTVLGGLLGGLLGGGGGSLIGPRPATPFSATGLTVGSDGLLQVGKTVSQIVDTQREVETLTTQVEALNQVLRAANVKIANAVSLDELGQERLIGGRSGSWLNFGQGGGRPSDLSGAWGELRFAASSNSVLDRMIAGREFASPEALAAAVQEVITFVDQTAPTLIALGKTTPDFGVGTLAAQISGLQSQFDAAIETAGKLQYQEQELTAAREAAIAAAQRAPIDALIKTDAGLDARFWAARAVNNNDPRMAFDASLLAFDARATEERDAFSDQLLTLLGEAGRTSVVYIDQMRRLDQTLYEERLTLLTQYNQQALAAEQAAQREQAQARENGESQALSVVASLREYARGLAFSDASPLSAQAQFGLASREFDAISGAAAAGDFRSIQGLPAAADTLLETARDIYGSGAAYVTVFERVRAALEALSNRDAESLVVAAIHDAEQSQTTVLASKLDDLRREMAAIKTELRQAALAPRAA